MTRDVPLPSWRQELSGEWDELAARLRAPPFLYPGWIVAWCRAFGGRLHTIEHRFRDELVGLVPVLVSGSAVRLPSNWHTPLSGSLASDADVARGLAATLAKSGVERLSLWPLDSDDRLVASWADTAAGFRLVTRQVFASPFVVTSDGWDTYLSTLSRKAFGEMRRRRRRLEEGARVWLDVRDGREELDRLLDEGFAIEGSGWKDKIGTSIALSPAADRFYRDVARWAADKGWLRLAFLRRDDKAIAFDYCLEHDRRHYLVKTGYRPEFSQHGPGAMLRLAMLERAFRSGIASYEFLGGEAPWKRTWTTSSRVRLRIDAFARTPARTVEWAAHAYARPIARQVITRTRSLVERRGRTTALGRAR